jgi:hypothetical protein
LSDDLEVTRVLAGYIVMKGDRKLAGPFGTWRAAPIAKKLCCSVK